MSRSHGKGFTEVQDIALVAWLDRDTLIKRLDAEIDTEADDASALTQNSDSSAKPR